MDSEPPGPALWPLEHRALGTDVVGLGENSLDHRVGVDEWPMPGEKGAWTESVSSPGGQVATALLGCARLGLRTAYLGAVGDDDAAERVLAPLVEAGVDLSGVQRIPGASTRSALILVRTGDGERSVLAQRDPRLGLDLEKLDREAIEAASLLHLDASDPDASLWAAGVAGKAGIPVVLDADAVGDGVEALLARVDFPVVSEGFARAWGGTERAADGLERLAAGGPRLAVVTCGARGALAATGSERLHVQAPDVDVLDTTGAGDAFHAGLIWALFQGFGARAALVAANAAAGLSCRALGAQDGLPSEVDLAQFLARGPAGESPGKDADHA